MDCHRLCPILFAAIASASSIGMDKETGGLRNVQFVTSRAEFSKLTRSMGLMFSDFTTTSGHVAESSLGSARPEVKNNATWVNFGLRFSHVRSGLPFDFSLQPGLVSVNTGRIRRRLREHPWALRVRHRMLRDHWRPSGRLLLQPASMVKAKANASRSSIASVNQKGSAVHDAARALSSAHPGHVKMQSHHGHGAEGLSEGSHGAQEKHGALSKERRKPLKAPHSALAQNDSSASWLDQIRFHNPRKHVGALEGSREISQKRAGKLQGNGGDDFTFTFPHEGESLYRVHAFGFEILDNYVTKNETLLVYSTSSHLIGVYKLPAAPPPGESRDSFIGFVSHTPIGFASFDESEASDDIGLAGFVFGYSEIEAIEYSLEAWTVLGLVLLCVLVLESLFLQCVPHVTAKVSLCWLLIWLALTSLMAIVLWLGISWRQCALFSCCVCMNTLLSADNLIVFMLLLQQVQLHERHHLKAISHGFLVALAIRLVFVLAGAALLQRFAWLMLVFAAGLMFIGLKMLCFTDEAPEPLLEAEQPVPWARRCIGACMPLELSDHTGGSYWARDARGRLCATRMAVVVVGIAVADTLFAVDSVPVVLSLTRSPFLLVASQAFSLLHLRPLYFLLSALASYMDSMQQALAVVLVLISLKIFLEAFGIQIPIHLFAGLLVAWRVVVGIRAVISRHQRAAALG